MIKLTQKNAVQAVAAPATGSATAPKVSFPLRPQPATTQNAPSTPATLVGQPIAPTDASAPTSILSPITGSPPETTQTVVDPNTAQPVTVSLDNAAWPAASLPIIAQNMPKKTFWQWLCGVLHIKQGT